MVFSDDLLTLCWKNEVKHGNALKSELWNVIKRTCEEIIGGKSKRDGYWLKKCLLPSNVKFNIFTLKSNKSDTECI